jgi:hypothetical protein
MKRILFILLMVGAALGGYLYLTRGNQLFSPQAGSSPVLAPKGTLDGVRAKAKQIEDQSQRQVDQLLKKTQ